MLHKENHNTQTPDQIHLKMEYDYLRFLYEILSDPKRISTAVQENAYIEDSHSNKKLKDDEKKEFLLKIDRDVFTKNGEERGSDRYKVNKRLSDIDSLVENAGFKRDELKKSSLRDRVIYASAIAAAEGLLNEKLFGASPDSLSDPEFLIATTTAISTSTRKVNKSLSGFHLKDAENGFSYEISDELEQCLLEKMKSYEEQLGINNNSFVAYLEDERVVPQINKRIDNILTKHVLEVEEHATLLARVFDDLRHPKDENGYPIQVKDKNGFPITIPEYKANGKFDLLYANFSSIIQNTKFPVADNDDLLAWLELKLITALDDLFTDEGEIQPELAILLNKNGGLDYAFNATHIGIEKTKSMLFAAYMSSIVFKEMDIILTMNEENKDKLSPFMKFYQQWKSSIKVTDSKSIAQMYQKLKDRLPHVKSKELKKLISDKVKEREVKLKIQAAQTRRDNLSPKEELNRLQNDASNIQEAINKDKEKQRTLVIESTKYTNSIASKTKEIAELDSNNKLVEKIDFLDKDKLDAALKSKQTFLESIAQEKNKPDIKESSSLSGWKLAGAIGLGIIALGGIAFLLTVVWPVVPVLAIGSAIFGAASVSASSSTIFAVTATAITGVVALLGGALGFLAEKKTNFMSKLGNLFSRKDKDHDQPPIKDATVATEAKKVELAKLEVSLVSKKLKKLKAEETINNLEKNIAKNTTALSEKEQQIAGVKETLRGLSDVSNLNSMFKKSPETSSKNSQELSQPQAESEEDQQQSSTPDFNQ